MWLPVRLFSDTQKRRGVVVWLAKPSFTFDREDIIPITLSVPQPPTDSRHPILLPALNVPEELLGLQGGYDVFGSLENWMSQTGLNRHTHLHSD